MKSYLSDRYQRVRIGSTYSEYNEIYKGVQQGSVLCPLLFNIFLDDFFLFVKEVSLCNFAHDNTLYAYAKVLNEVVRSLELETTNILDWFKFNSIAANPAKFQLMFLGNVSQFGDIKVNVNNTVLTAKSSVKLLGVNIDCKLNFNEHVTRICKTASGKVKALYRIRPYLNVYSAKRLCEAFILSSFNHCPLIWMFSSK